jgi:UrcA family protein
MLRSAAHAVDSESETDMTIKYSWTRSSVLAVAALVASGGMITQHAEAEEAAGFLGVETHTVSVRYDDLDLRDETDMKTLRARISSAARQACGHVDRRNLRENAFWQQCYRAAMSDAVAQVDDERFARWAGYPNAVRSDATL